MFVGFVPFPIPHKTKHVFLYDNKLTNISNSVGLESCQIDTKPLDICGNSALDIVIQIREKDVTLPFEQDSPARQNGTSIVKRRIIKPMLLK
jgi:hypothetical protein